MLRLILNFVFLASIPQAFPKRIVGGTTADIADYPYQVALLFNGYPGCGGSILKSNFILTAAHCTVILSSTSQLKIRAGSSLKNSGGQVVGVANIYQHPNYSRVTNDYDLSVVELSTPLIFDDNVQPISLADANYVLNDGDLAIATGWGKLSQTGVESEELQVVDLPVITTDTCKTYYGSIITENMFCAGYTAGGKDTCSGDSGGPLALNGVLIGVISAGKKCAAAGQPGVLTKVSEFRSYIDPIIS